MYKNLYITTVDVRAAACRLPCHGGSTLGGWLNILLWDGRRSQNDRFWPARTADSRVVARLDFLLFI
jgi:phage baseplate assembly protein gpV